MIHVSMLVGEDTEGNPTNSPAQPFPSNATAIVCDGDKYIVYQVGDDIPATEPTSE